MNSPSLARGLAFFSVGLGLTQLIAPRRLSRLIGVNEDHETLMRLLGMRELGAITSPATFAASRTRRLGTPLKRPRCAPGKTSPSGSSNLATETLPGVHRA